MFGNNNQDNPSDQNTHTQNQPMDANEGLGSPTDDSVPSLPSMFNQPSADNSQNQPSQAPTAEDANQQTPAAGQEHQPMQPTAPESPSEGPSDDSAPQVDGSLIDIKQQALQHLSPLVSHLDQTPEEKFRTTMMMIQATDDQSLLKAAYDSAQKIADDKARAQALLDVINEINYFTQQSNNS